MAFNPRTEYDTERTNIRIRDFSAYADEYETRPPYQRKVVWERKKQQALLDSLFRRFYIPSVVIRLVRLGEMQTKYEVVDGQQRINTVQAFFQDELPLPDSLSDINTLLPNCTYSRLPAEIKKFVDRELKFDVDIIKNISDPLDTRHQETATEIFWRLQQGESLNKMETAHARLSSLVRNFLVKYADDSDFDFSSYVSIDDNPHKLGFFSETRARSNSRMQHLTLLGRFLLLEISGGPTNIGDQNIVTLIDETIQADGIGNTSYEQEVPARAVLQNLKEMYKVFHDDPLLDTTTYGTGVLAFRFEYFTISCYLLLRHLLKYYVFSNETQLCFRDFAYDFFERTKGISRATEQVVRFVENRQQNVRAVEIKRADFPS